jgi:hypothetical protein
MELYIHVPCTLTAFTGITLYFEVCGQKSVSKTSHATNEMRPLNVYPYKRVCVWGEEGGFPSPQRIEVCAAIREEEHLLVESVSMSRLQVD